MTICLIDQASLPSRRLTPEARAARLAAIEGVLRVSQEEHQARKGAVLDAVQSALGE